MAYLRPGVYVQETLNPTQPTVGPNSDSVAAFVGPNDRGPTVPTLVTSWSAYTALYGTWNTYNANDLPIAVYLFFANGGRQAYIRRVVYSGDTVTPSNNATTAAITLKDRTSGTALNTLTLSATNEGKWGNSISVIVTDSTVSGYFNLFVAYNMPATYNEAYIVERYTDISMTATDARYAPSVINIGSAYIIATDAGAASTGATRNPATSTVTGGVPSPTALASGSNGLLTLTTAQYSTALSSFDTIQQSLIMNLPSITDSTNINNALSYAAGRGDVFVVIDGDTNSFASTAITTASSYGTSSTGSYGAVYYPRVIISDPTVTVGSASNTTRVAAPGGAVIGVYASTDASRGVFKAPAGLQARLANVVSVPSLSNSDLDSLNSASVPVNAIKYVPGTGIVVMGARTLKQGYVDKYVPVRRTLIYLEKSLKDLSQFAIFEPNDPALWRRVNATLSTFLTQFWSQGGLVGAVPSQAYFVKCDATNNPQTSIDNGELHIDVGVALQRPAEFVIIKIGQFNGGITVTVA
jgi:uncharacterized protein